MLSGRIIVWSTFWLVAVGAMHLAYCHVTGLVESRSYSLPDGMPVTETTVHPSPWWLMPSTAGLAVSGVAVIVMVLRWRESKRSRH